MILRSRYGALTQRGGPAPDQGIPAALDQLSDDQLITERDRQRRRLDELTVNPGRSPAVCALLVSIDRDIEEMTEELIRRARS